MKLSHHGKSGNPLALLEEVIIFVSGNFYNSALQKIFIV